MLTGQPTLPWPFWLLTQPNNLPVCNWICSYQSPNQPLLPPITRMHVTSHHRWWSSKRVDYRIYTGKETGVLHVQGRATLCASTIRTVPSGLVHARTEIQGETLIAALEYNLHSLELISMNLFSTHGMRSKISVNIRYLAFTVILRILLLANTIAFFNQFVCYWITDWFFVSLLFV